MSQNFTDCLTMGVKFLEAVKQRQLASHGVTVVLTSRDESVGVESAKVLQEGGLTEVACHQLDILDPSSINQFADWLKENYGGLDILNNAKGETVAREREKSEKLYKNEGVTGNHRRQLNKCGGFREKLLQERE
ncbi:(+)-neomenthol dehydrogenase [Glycine soja]